MVVDHLQCPGCGARLTPKGRDAFFCAYCGAHLRVRAGPSGNPIAVLDDIKTDTSLLARTAAWARLEERIGELTGRQANLRANLEDVRSQARFHVSSGGWPGLSLGAGLFLMFVGLVGITEGKRDVLRSGTSEPIDFRPWYLQPAWRSLVTWPLAFYYLGGVLYGLSFGAALHWDLLRWNPVLWLFFGWHLPLLVSLLLAGCYFLGMHLTYSTRHTGRLRSCWMLRLRVLGTLVLMPAAAAAFLMVAEPTVTPAVSCLGAALSTCASVMRFFSQLGLWTSIR